MCYDDCREVQMHSEAVSALSKVLIVDDFLVSGGTIAAGLNLVRQAGGSVAGVACVVEAPAWKARERLAEFGSPIETLATITL